MNRSRVTLARIDAAPTQVTLESGDDCLDAAVERQAREARATIAVDDHVRRSTAQAKHGAAHGQQRRLQDIDRIHFAGVGPAEPPGDAALPDSPRQFFTHGGRETFESAMPRIGCLRSRITAAATTGPASGPRPTSSIPAVRPALRRSKPACRGSARLIACHSAGSAVPGWRRRLAHSRRVAASRESR